MKNPWLVYVTVAVISALAGIAIAGLPNTVGTDATIIVPEVTTSTTTTSTSEPDPEPAPTTIEAERAQTTTTTEAAETTTTTEPESEIDRAIIEVVAVNGASIGGLATRIRDELRDLGFERASSADGTEIVDETVVYFAPGFEAEAVEVAEALNLELRDVKPIEDAPSFDLDDDDQVAVYLGRDNS